MPSLMSLSAPSDALLRQIHCHRHLLDFARWLFPNFQTARHLEFIADRLEAVERGDCRRLIIELPPRHGKTTLVSHLFPPWYLGRNPDRRIIACSYSVDLAFPLSRLARNVIEDPRYRAIFPDVTLDPASHAVGQWDLAMPHRGGYLAAGIGGGITGHGAAVAIIDDPLKNAAEARSSTVTSAQWQWYTSTLYSRLEPDGAVILTMTRWSEGDLAGRLIDAAQSGEGDQWEVLRLPALAEDDDPMGREPGEALWPERYNAAKLEAIKQTSGPRNFAAMYQQRPVPEGGAKFKREWFELVDSAPRQARRCRFWDLAATEPEPGKDPDWSVGVKMARHEGVYFIEDVVRFRGSPQTIDRRLRETADMDGRECSQVMEQEPGASGKVAIAHFRTTVFDGYQFQAVPATGSKELRANPVSSTAEAGNLKVVRASWNGEYFSEMIQFPAGGHDDQVDGTSGAHAWLASQTGSQMFRPEWFRRTGAQDGDD